MMLALAAALGLIISLLRHRGRTPQQIAAISLRSTWLVLVALAMQWPMLSSPVGETDRLGVQRVLLILSHLVLLVFVWQNRQMVSVQFVGLGVLFNLLAIVANGGFMPITPEMLARVVPGKPPEYWLVGAHYGYSKDIILRPEQIRLGPLTDTLLLPSPFPKPTAFSLGDVLIGIGVIALLQGPGRLRASPVEQRPPK